MGRERERERTKQREGRERVSFIYSEIRYLGDTQGRGVSTTSAALHRHD